MNYNIDISYFKRKIREFLWVYINLNYYNCILIRLKKNVGIRIIFFK